MSTPFRSRPEDVPVEDAVNSDRPEAAGDGAAIPDLDPRRLGHGVHARGSSSGSAGMHVEDAALPSPNHTGAGLGGIQIGDSRF